MQYNPIVDIMNSWGLGVKVSFKTLNSSDVSKHSNSRSRHYGSKANGCDRILNSSAVQKNDKLDPVVIRLTSSKPFILAEEYRNRIYPKTDRYMQSGVGAFMFIISAKNTTSR